MSVTPLIGVVMGSRSDFSVMRSAVELLREFGVPHEARVVSAHRTPDLLFEYASQAEARGLRVIIAGAGGAAHLPGMLAAKTIVPVLGVPIAATALQGFDALLSIVQMPKGVPVGTLAIGAAGAANAALLAVQILATTDPALAEGLHAWRNARRDEVLGQSLAEDPEPAQGWVPHSDVTILRHGIAAPEPSTDANLDDLEALELPHQPPPDPGDSFLAERTRERSRETEPSTESTIDRLEESAL